MKRSFPPRVHRKRSKGRVYYYFNTGRRNEHGRPILTPLPDYTSKGFGRAYAACVEAMEDGGADDGELTVPELCERFRRSPKFSKLSKGTKESYLTYLAVIERELDTFLAEEVVPRDVLALQEKLKARPAAANQTVRTMSALYAWGKRAEVGLVRHNPAAGIELYEGGEHEPWPEWLVKKALGADDQLVRLAVHLLYYTAARVGDVAKLKWSDVQDGFLVYVPEKTRRKRPEGLEVKIHERLAAMLATVPRGVHTTILTRPDGKPYGTRTISNRVMDFAAEHGVKVATHGLRKNAVNALLEVGCTVAEVQSISGQTLQVIEHYAKKRDRRKLSVSAMKLWENKR